MGPNSIEAELVQSNLLGHYVSFSSSPCFDLKIDSLENKGAGIRLLNVQHRRDKDGNFSATAVVFVPHGKEHIFLNKLIAYQQENRTSGVPKNRDLVESINTIKQAFVRALWTGHVSDIPEESKIWCEVWLRKDNLDQNDQHAIEDLQNTTLKLALNQKPQALNFVEQTVMLVEANKNDLEAILEKCSYVSEFRKGDTTAKYWMNLNRVQEVKYSDELLSRMNVKNDANTFVCIVDSGVMNEHPLLQSILSAEDCLTYDSEWGTTDGESHHYGHGTLMCGLAAFYSLEDVLTTSATVSLNHRLSSVKILPNTGENEPELWGEIIKEAVNQAVSRMEIANPSANVIYCSAVTAPSQSTNGHPSSWSSAIDQISFGEEGKGRLFLVSAGNVLSKESWDRYPDANLLTCVSNPAQSWNALTIGAYTEKTVILTDSLQNYSTIAPYRGISPFNSSSNGWEKTKWPYKPDVVFEGGNVACSEHGDCYSDLEELSILSTSKSFTQNLFGTINGTSAAVAQAAWFAAQIAEKYPSAWPETIRGLIVHSADWPQEIINQFSLDTNLRSDRLKLLRICGYGIPSLDKALDTANNSVTYVAQETIQPFLIDNESVKLNHIHFIKLPWPTEILMDNPDIEVKVKVTLSYFVEPNPGEKGWGNKYRYQSHGLRFELNSQTESEEDFVKRLNKAARSEIEDYEGGQSDSSRWQIGIKNRTAGSIHCDTWITSAASVATCNTLAVFPVGGWWKEKSHSNRASSPARYSLLVTLETQETEVDLYTVVATRITAQQEIKISG